MNAIPTATSLESARNLRNRYQDNDARGARHHILLGDCTETAQTYFIATVRETKRLIAAGYEVLE